MNKRNPNTKSSFPDNYRVVDPIERTKIILSCAKRCVASAVRFLPKEAPDYMSTHNRGGGPMLDRELYDEKPSGE